jgi:murein DD-endopeptidase MepM/ murein hydrolase activator NlpD
MADANGSGKRPEASGSSARSVGALALVVGFVVILAGGRTPSSAGHNVLGTRTATATATPTWTPTPTATATPTWTPSPTLTQIPTATPTRTGTPTPVPTVSTPPPLPAAAHLWLAPPIAEDGPGDRYPGGYFPYGATGGGRYHLHHGVDYANPAGTPVLAAGAGIVVAAGDDMETVYGLKPDFYGNLVVQELDQRFGDRPVYVLYGHLSEVIASVGEHLEPGGQVGLVGMEGVAIGNHLHLEVRLGANDYESTRNPVLWLRPEPDQGVIAGLVLDARGKPVPETIVTFFRAAEPNKWWRQIQTYADREVNADDELGENFALGYVPAGEYLVKVKVGERSVVRPVAVRAGEVAFVLIQAKP